MDILGLLVDFFESIGLEKVKPYLLALMVLLSAFWGGRKALIWYQTRKLTLHLRPFYEDEEVQAARKYYVETNCQNLPPSVKDEIRTSTTIRKRIIRYFLRDAFPPPGDGRKFYLILGGSGTGKTTFMINLCYRYMAAWWGKQYGIQLFPISHPGTLAAIEKIKEEGNAPDTILLLDALDEDQAAAENFPKRMHELLVSASDFKDVIITCRTQFIPNEEAIPGEVRIKKWGTNRGYHLLEKLYISPFNEKEIDRYLRKMFGRIPLGKKRKLKNKARGIVKKAPNLMARPMLLGKIELLLEDPHTEYKQIHEIYKVMIDRWLQREADRRFEDRDVIKVELRNFSRELARFLYLQWRSGGPLHMSKEALLTFKEEFNINLGEVDMESKSLLNKDPLGNLKFSHKSILEYFIALQAKEDYGFYCSLDFEGMDMVKQFAEEMIPIPPMEMILIQGGDFAMGSGADHQISISDFWLGQYPITQRQWQAVMGNSPSRFKGDDRPVETVSWEDCQAFIQKLNELSGLTFRLPTEAEWEYAVGGGSENRTIWAGTSEEQELIQYAWYSENGEGTTHPVGQKLPNALDLYDMSGNVWEWCNDRYEEDGAMRVIRGGSWNDGAAGLRVAYRYGDAPVLRSRILGFRLARTL